MKNLLALAVGIVLAVAGPLALAAQFNTLVALTGAKENPTNPSPGLGSAEVTLDTTARTLRVSAIRRAHRRHHSIPSPLLRRAARQCGCGHHHAVVRRLPARRDQRLHGPDLRHHPGELVEQCIHHGERRHAGVR